MQPQTNQTSYAKNFVQQRALGGVIGRQKSVESLNANYVREDLNFLKKKDFKLSKQKSSGYQNSKNVVVSSNSNSRTSNSAPVPSQPMVIQSRPTSSTGNHINHFYHQEQKYATPKNPVIVRNADKANYQQNGVGSGILYRPISATDLRANAKPVFGRKQFNNQTNMTANLAAKNMFGNYNGSATHGTISNNGLNAIKKWW